ncbi:PP2C family protein-serine/threonine phosphatase [Chondromyces apiculatus]|uniref:Protein serine/threonine phosphatase PrpC, regulation of stationary phase n=1 Tax=Chondromyces apiculatus DSM 436 TaxID=1192034 RepID=A0A017TE09_9BACT|nr:protein phosphatase 2C domain-containing protein [Chondromyces apiculatus]EYF06856.1 Protein serine/threonine phosphatase PrpC, regulation of stationary phase [Chondromyces apiculatus DSM 436]
MAGLTDRGLVRSSNEDAFFFAHLGTGEQWQHADPVTWRLGERGVLLAVSDGMGGANAGEVASALSLEKLLEGMRGRGRPRENDADRLRRTIEQASRQVRRAAARPGREGMGATLTAVYLRGSTATIAEIGDSRAYLIRRGHIFQVTRDQSYVQLLVDAGLMTQEEAERSPRRNIVLQAMGQDTDVIVALGRLDLRRGDRLLLCTDGLSGLLDDKQILQYAGAPTRVERACADLVELAKDAGGDDNITVLLAETDGPGLRTATAGDTAEATIKTVQEYKP